jgi:hypothetical protein
MCGCTLIEQYTLQHGMIRQRSIVFDYALEGTFQIKRLIRLRETQGIVPEDRLSDTLVTANVTVGVMTCRAVQWQVQTCTGWSNQWR